MEKSIYTKVASVALTGAIALTGCTSRFESGQKVTAAENISVTTDYNAVDYIKPRCTIPAGAEVQIGEFSSLNNGGGSEKIPLVQLKSEKCTGWAIDDPSLNNKLIEKP